MVLWLPVRRWQGQDRCDLQFRRLRSLAMRYKRLF
jgi:hypothetical protein